MATAAFSDSASPLRGIVTRFVASCWNSGRMPFDSVVRPKKTSTKRQRMSKDADASESESESEEEQEEQAQQDEDEAMEEMDRFVLKSKACHYDLCSVY